MHEATPPAAPRNDQEPPGRATLHVRNVAPAAARPDPHPYARRRPPRPPGRPPTRPLRLGNPRRRLRAAVVVFAVLLIVVAGQLIWLQGFRSQAYAKKAELQRLKTVPLPAVRGSILDRDGNVLAQDVDARNIEADPSEVTDRTGTAVKLSPLLHVSVADLVTKLSRPGRYALLATGVTPAVGSAVTKLGLPGITPPVATQRRDYPSHQLAASVVGFTTMDQDDRIVGRGGLELAYDAQLRGKDGTLKVEQDPSGRPIPLGERREVEPVRGSDVQLTIDRDIQWAAQSQITKAVSDTHAVSGTVIVTNPRTGEVLAMASAPSFDPGKVTSTPASNPGTADVYEPGSVNKVITMAAAIDRGIVSPTTPVTVPPTLPITRSYTLHDDEVHGTEQLTAAGVLAKSSNIGTVLIARKLGADVLAKELRAFGLGSETAVAFPGESAGLIPKAPWSLTTATTIPFGQGMSATALQMAGVYGTIADGGVRVPPRLVASTVDGSGKRTANAPLAGTRVVSTQAAAAVTTMLEKVVSKDGTAPLAAIDGYRVAGKTGTANRPDGKGGYSGYTASFVGFAPADKPQLLVEVVLDNPTTNHYGGQVAAPVFKNVMSFALQSLRIPPTGTTAPDVPLEAP